MVRDFAATPEKASASTVMLTGCPGTAGKLGVSSIATSGSSAVCVARSTIGRVVVVLPSVTLSSTR